MYVTCCPSHISVLFNLHAALFKILPEEEHFYLKTWEWICLLLTVLFFGNGSTNLRPHPGSLGFISLLRSFFRNSLSIMSGLSNATTSTTNCNTWHRELSSHSSVLLTGKLLAVCSVLKPYICTSFQDAT